MSRRALRSNAQLIDRDQAVAVEIPVKRRRSVNNQKQATTVAGPLAGSHSPPTKKARKNNATSEPVSRQLRSRYVGTPVSLSPNAKVMDEHPDAANDDNRTDTPVDLPADEERTEGHVDHPASTQATTLDANNAPPLFLPVGEALTQEEIVVDTSSVERLAISPADLETPTHGLDDVLESIEQTTGWYPSANASFSENQVQRPVVSPITTVTSSPNEPAGPSGDLSRDGRTSPSPLDLDFPEMKEALRVHAPFEATFGEAERLKRLLDTEYVGRRKQEDRVTVQQFCCELYARATENMDFEERTNLLTICFAYKTKAQVLEYLERVPYPWAERAIAIVEERGRDRFEGNLAAHLALIPNRNSTEGISKKMDMSKAGGVEPTSVARQTRFGRVPAPSGESEAVSRSDAGSNDQPASSIASTHVGGATPSPEDLNPQPTHPIRATRSTQKLVSPPANANATASDIASRLFPTNPVGQPTPAPRTTPASPPPAPIFIIPTLSAGYPAHSVFVYARLVPLPALTTEAILAHPSFRQLYLGQDLMKATKPVLPHSVMVDKDRAKQYNALLSHLALGRDILYSWANNPVLCRNSKKAGYQLDDIQDWIEVIRTGREERMRELSGNGGAAGNGSAERRNVTFAQVLERVRIIEARDEGEEDEECDEDEYGGDAVATGDEIEWGVEPELEMEGVVPAGEAWC